MPKYTGPWCASRLSMPRASFIWNAAAASIAGFVCGAALWLQQHPKPAVPAVAPPVTGVILRVKPEGRAVHLSWNRNSETIRNATHARLHIEDGTHHSQLDLDPRELSVGTLSYWPETEVVKFRLEVVSDVGTTDGTIQFASGAPLPQRLPEVMPQTLPEVVATRHTPQRRPVRTASRATLDEAKPSPFNAPPPPPKEIAAPAASEPAVAAVSEPPVKPAAVRRTPPPVPEPEPALSIPARPSSRSFLGRVVHKIPLVRRLKRKTDQRGGGRNPGTLASSGRPD